MLYSYAVSLCFPTESLYAINTNIETKSRKGAYLDGVVVPVIACVVIKNVCSKKEQLSILLT